MSETVTEGREAVVVWLPIETRPDEGHFLVFMPGLGVGYRYANPDPGVEDRATLWMPLSALTPGEYHGGDAG